MIRATGRQTFVTARRGAGIDCFTGVMGRWPGLGLHAPQAAGVSRSD